MKNINQKNWDDWRWQLRNSQNAFHELRSEQKVSSGIKEVEKKFPSFVTPYYCSLINKSDIPEDPIYKQIFPDVTELQNLPGFEEMDPLHEEEQMPIPDLIHRYNDRAVLLTTNSCAVHCRFCLRKRKWNENGTSVISDTKLDKVVSYLEKNKKINEILVSGGDPLMLENEKLLAILMRISQISSVEIIRLGTRIPVVLPMRIDNELAEMLAAVPGLWVAVHFNHPRELTDESINACSKLIKRGIPVINQTVLLKNINDDVKTLTLLFRTLAANRIKPHYLFHIDPVAGNAHFATGIQKGIDLMRKFRNTLSSLETPVFAIDLPGGGGKVPLIPDYCKDGKFETLDGEWVEYRI